MYDYDFLGGNEDRKETNPKQDFGEDLRKMRNPVGHKGNPLSNVYNMM